MKHMDMTDAVYGVPIPRRFLPLVYGVLADAYRAEASTEASDLDAPATPPEEVGLRGWTKKEVLLAYHESTPKQRAALDYLADRPDQEVTALELAHEVYPGYSDDEAWNKLNGSLGGFGTRVKQQYGKAKWFFLADRPDPHGYMVYTMRAKEAAWVREASGRPDPE